MAAPRLSPFLRSRNFVLLSNFGLGLDYDARLPDLLNAVTLEEANRAATRAMDPERATVVIAGPYQAE